MRGWVHETSTLTHGGGDAAMTLLHWHTSPSWSATERCMSFCTRSLVARSEIPRLKYSRRVLAKACKHDQNLVNLGPRFVWHHREHTVMA
jgi:hypothetical protein